MIKPKIIVFTALFVAALFGDNAAAKIGAPAPAEENGVRYEGIMNYVQAVDKKTGKIIWKTVVYKDIEPEKPDMRERDVQWNVIVRVGLKGGYVEVEDKKGRVFLLDKKGGKLKGGS